MLKKVCALLSVSTIITTLLFIVIVGIGIFATVVGLGDPNGGWGLLLLVCIFGIVLFPCLLVWLLQFFLFLTGLKKYRKNDMRKAKKRWKMCSVLSIVANVYLICLSRVFSGEESLQNYVLALVVLAVMGIIYRGIVIGMLSRWSDSGLS